MSRLPLLPVLVLKLVAGVTGCKSKEAPAPTISPPDLQLVSAGNEPRRLLRYRAAEGQTQKLEVAIDVALEAGEMGGQMPTVVIAMTLTVDAVFPTGQMKLRTTIDHATVREHPDSQVPTAALAGPMQALKGLAIDAVLAPNGRLTGAKVDTAGKSLAKEIEGQLTSLVASFEQTLMPLPDEPVGVGAVWRSSRPIDRNGMKLTAVSSIALTRIAGDEIAYTIDTDIHGADQTITQGELAIEVKDLVGSGAGTGTIDLVTLAVTSELGAEFRSEMSAPGEESPTKMTMTTRSSVRPR